MIILLKILVNLMLVEISLLGFSCRLNVIFNKNDVMNF